MLSAPILNQPWRECKIAALKPKADCHSAASIRARLSREQLISKSGSIKQMIALLKGANRYDHIECGKHSAADVVAKAQAALSEAELLRAMFNVGYFPPNTPPQ